MISATPAHLVFFLGGFVAAEGNFTCCAANNHLTFTFAVQLGAIDRGTCELFRTSLGVGTIFVSPRRKPHYDDEVHYAVRKLTDLVDTIVPFMDEHLPPSYKREQYLEWREKLLDYWEHDAKRVRECTIDGCTEPRRAKGLCRGHYFQEYRR